MNMTTSTKLCRLLFYLYANETNVGKIQQMSGKIVFMIDDAKFNYSPLH